VRGTRPANRRASILKVASELIRARNECPDSQLTYSGVIGRVAAQERWYRLDILHGKYGGILGQNVSSA
jgi:hypothetical protein